ncbi:hypothetical protein ASC59_09775 [Leifsonia sp. Root1293]|nr:hypothetical protein ASC59_09775 [Leifsonia sp. Root1293]KRA12257.1 hypothetical protein ASD61_09775 [Leifsonia sp. Root60]
MSTYQGAVLGGALADAPDGIGGEDGDGITSESGERLVGAGGLTAGTAGSALERRRDVGGRGEQVDGIDVARLERLASAGLHSQAADGVSQHHPVGEVTRMDDAVALREAPQDPGGQVVGGVQLLPLRMPEAEVARIGEVEGERPGIEPPRLAVAGREPLPRGKTG